MSNEYNIKHTDMSIPPKTVEEGGVNDYDLDIALFGRIRLEYGERLNQNLLNILENFACPMDPNYGAPEITPEPSPTPTPTVGTSVTPTPTPTITPSPTAGVTVTPTRSPTSTPDPTPNPSVSSTPGVTATPTPTPTPTVSVTASPAVSPSVTPTATPTPTPSLSFEGVVDGFSASRTDTNGGAAAISSLIMATDGTLVTAKTGDTHWYTPTTGGIGSSYWMEVTAKNIMFDNGGASNFDVSTTRYSLSTSRQFEVIADSASEAEQHTVWTVAIWNAASGGSVVGTGTISLHAVKTF